MEEGGSAGPAGRGRSVLNRFLKSVGVRVHVFCIITW